jgi:hypothetical protein
MTLYVVTLMPVVLLTAVLNRPAVSSVNVAVPAASVREVRLPSRS